VVLQLKAQNPSNPKLKIVSKMTKSDGNTAASDIHLDISSGKQSQTDILVDYFQFNEFRVKNWKYSHSNQFRGR